MFDLKKEIEEGASLVGGVLYKGGEEIGRWLNGVLHIHGVGQFQPHEIKLPRPAPTVTDPMGQRTIAPIPEGSLKPGAAIPAAAPEVAPGPPDTAKAAPVDNDVAALLSQV